MRVRTIRLLAVLSVVLPTTVSFGWPPGLLVSLLIWSLVTIMTDGRRTDAWIVDALLATSIALAIMAHWLGEVDLFSWGRMASYLPFVGAVDFARRGREETSSIPGGVLWGVPLYALGLVAITMFLMTTPSKAHFIVTAWLFASMGSFLATDEEDESFLWAAGINTVGMLGVVVAAANWGPWATIIPGMAICAAAVHAGRHRGSHQHQE